MRLQRLTHESTTREYWRWFAERLVIGNIIAFAIAGIVLALVL